MVDSMAPAATHTVEIGEAIDLPDDQRPILLVVSDTEEEFAWDKPFDRTSTSVSAMAQVPVLQAICDEFDIKPCYVIDYPVASQEEGYGPLRAISDAGRCEIGAHLHPWVNPPHDETVDNRHSFQGNLERELESRKIELLKEEIQENLGIVARAFKCGRYGIGPHTRETLRQLGFDIDLSPSPPFDFTDAEGPDFSRHPNDPRRLDGDLLCLPCTGAFIGFLSRAARPIYRLASSQPLRWARLVGIMSRLRALERMRLSPEGFTVDENIRLTRWLYRHGARVFTYSFHSPSLEPGHTPYVRTQADLDRFLDAFRRFFDFFIHGLGGISMTPEGIRNHILTAKE